MNVARAAATFLLTYADTVLELELCGTTGRTVKPVLDFLTSHWRLTPADDRDRRVTATLRFRPYDTFTRDACPDARFAPVVIRRSSAEAFNLHGDRAAVGPLEVVDCPRTGTAFVFERPARRIDIYVSDRSRVQLIEFLRELVIRHQEHHDTVVLHAAALARNGRAVVLVGGKGAGKSTLLLDLVTRPGWQYLSGDKVLLSAGPEGEGIVAHGWPDYPHLGCGTIQSNPRLRQGLEGQGVTVSGLPPDRKLLLEPDTLQRALGFEPVADPLPLGTVLLPDVRGADRPEVAAVPAPPSHEVLRHLEFSAANDLGGWHSFIPRRPEAELRSGPARRLAGHLAGCRFVRVAGPGPYPAELEVLVP